MSTFTVYPKEGDPFILHCERFELRDNGFVLHGSDGESSTDQAFLSIKTVAAVIPEQQRRDPGSVSLKNFRVYLRNQATDNPILVSASGFDAEHQPNVIFFWLPLGPGQADPKVVSDVYVASSDVIAILPPKL